MRVMNASAAPVALVVEPNAANRLRTVTALASAGFHVTATEAFEAARQWIATSPPAVLVTALKLGEYNGLHLVLRARATSPRTVVLVLSDDGGADFKREAQHAGATFLVDPVTPSELVAALFRTIYRRDETVHIEPPFERRQTDRRKASAEHLPNRRAGERRRDIGTLLQAASLG